MSRILIVDDEPQILRLLRTALRSSGYEVFSAANGMEGLEIFQRSRPDLVITDLAMPGMDGLALTQAVRAIATTPVLVLSVRETDVVKVNALDRGADDYLTKPFSMPELLARVRALLRRAAQEDDLSPLLEHGHLAVDSDAHTARLEGQQIRLTPKEFELLRILMQNADRVVPHRKLLQTIWGPGGESQPEYLRVLVGQLRRKLDRDGRRYIQSEPWVGYRIRPFGDADD